MSDLRFWILTLTTVTFFAGVAGGVIVSNSQRAETDQPPFTDFESRFVQEFGLDVQRSEALRVLLNHYQRDVQRIEEDHLAATSRDMEPELNRVGVYYAHLIRDKILPTAADRARYDELSAGSPLPQTLNR